MITAVILAGGLGTRLAPIVSHLPKALAPIQGTPFLQILLAQLEQSSLISKVVFALGHKSENIERFLDKKSYSFTIDVSIEKSPLGTGGALLYALDKTQGETLLVLNGDSYCELCLDDFYHSHQSRNAQISIACREVEDVSRYGSVEIESTQAISAFHEKSPHRQRGWINAGIYLFQRSLFSHWEKGIYSLEKDFFPYFLTKKIFAYQKTGAFIDIGTPSSYEEAQMILKPWITT